MMENVLCVPLGAPLRCSCGKLLGKRLEPAGAKVNIKCRGCGEIIQFEAIPVDKKEAVVLL